MDVTEKILDSLTEEDIIHLMTTFGVGYKRKGRDLVFQSHCHGNDAYKLYYYTRNSDGDTHTEEGKSCKHFNCYSSCGGMSVFNTFMQINDWDFKETLHYLAEYKSISLIKKKEKKFGVGKTVLDDWSFISKYKQLDRARDREPPRKLPRVDERVLNVFDNVYPSSWEDEGITLEAMHKFGIGFFTNQFKVSIPHRDMWGRLVGIRGRAFLKRDVDSGAKYSPLYVENIGYRHPLKQNLYGLYENLSNIKRLKKVLLVEGEKGVLMCESFYPNNGFAVAICGTNMSNYQRDLLVHECGVEEVIIALDKQYKTNLDTEEDRKEYDIYIKKVTKIANLFVNYCNVNIVYCEDDRLEYKDSPVDQGKDVFEQLMKEKERYCKNGEE